MPTRASTGCSLPRRRSDPVHTDSIVDYDLRPPAGGMHNPAWWDCGFYDEAAPTSTSWTTSSTAPWARRRPLIWRRRASRSSTTSPAPTRYVIAALYPALEPTGAVVATAWSRQLRLDAVDDPRLAAFVEQYQDGSQRPSQARPARAARSAIRSPRTTPRSATPRARPRRRRPRSARPPDAVPRPEQQVGRLAPKGRVALGVPLVEGDPVGTQARRSTRLPCRSCAGGWSRGHPRAARRRGGETNSSSSSVTPSTARAASMSPPAASHRWTAAPPGPSGGLRNAPGCEPAQVGQVAPRSIAVSRSTKLHGARLEPLREVRPLGRRLHLAEADPLACAEAQKGVHPAVHVGHMVQQLRAIPTRGSGRRRVRVSAGRRHEGGAVGPRGGRCARRRPWASSLPREGVPAAVPCVHAARSPATGAATPSVSRRRSTSGSSAAGDDGGVIVDCAVYTAGKRRAGPLAVGRRPRSLEGARLLRVDRPARADPGRVRGRPARSSRSTSWRSRTRSPPTSDPSSRCTTTTSSSSSRRRATTIAARRSSSPSSSSSSERATW